MNNAKSISKRKAAEYVRALDLINEDIHILHDLRKSLRTNFNQFPHRGLCTTAVNSPESDKKLKLMKMLRAEYSGTYDNCILRVPGYPESAFEQYNKVLDFGCRPNEHIKPDFYDEFIAERKKFLDFCVKSIAKIIAIGELFTYWSNTEVEDLLDLVTKKSNLSDVKLAGRFSELRSHVKSQIKENPYNGVCVIVSTHSTATEASNELVYIFRNILFESIYKFLSVADDNANDRMKRSVNFPIRSKLREGAGVDQYLTLRDQEADCPWVIDFLNERRKLVAVFSDILTLLELKLRGYEI